MNRSKTVTAVKSRRARHSASRPGSARTNGLLLAGAVALLSIGALLWASRFGTRARQADPAPVSVDKAPTQETELSGSDITLQLVDKNDPGRLAAEMKLPSIQPLEGKRYAVDHPTAWLYPRDGRVVWVRADRAELFLPNRQQLPERGDLRGGVIIRLFEGPAGRKIDPEKETPLLESTSDHMAFDGAIGELQVPGRILVRGSGLEYAGTSIRALFNDPEQRLEFLSAETSEFIRYSPKKARELPSVWVRPAVTPARTAAQSSPATPAPGKSGSTGRAQSPEPAVAKREHLYRVSAQDSVQVRQAGREIRSDLLEVFARLIDNQFPKRAGDAALNVGGSSRGDAPAIRQVALRQPVESSPLPKRNAADRVRSSNDDPVEITWKGRLEIRPQAPGVDLLEGNDLALRFTGDGGGVSLSDSGARVRGVGDSVTYLDTVREVRLASARPQGAMLIAAGSGRAIVTDARMNLATGEASFRGAGRLENSDSDDSALIAERGVSWSDAASLFFTLNERGDPQMLRQANFQGKARAGAGKAEVTADRMNLEFDPRVKDRPLLASVSLDGEVRASDAQQASLKARSMHVRFSAPGAAGGEAIASVLLARGSVEGASKGMSLHAEELDATLGVDPEGKTIATVVAARNGVRIEGRDGLRAECDELAADVVQENAELAGSVVVLAKGESSVSGTRMRLTGATARLDVVGPGVFLHRGKNKAGGELAASAKWSEGMSYEDLTGELLAQGGAIAEAMPDANTRDKLQAETIRVLMTPGSEERSAASAVDGKQPAGQPKELLSVAAIGSSAAPAKVESRRFESATSSEKAPAQAAPKLERLLYLESQQVDADNRAGTLHTPGAGKILIVDQRENPHPEEGETGFGRGAGRGRTLISWRDSMSMDRATQTMKIGGGVNLLNLRQPDNQKTQLDCDRLTAILASSSRPSGLDSMTELKGELSRAIADGHARLSSGTKELLGEIIDYNAAEGVATAGSGDGSMVTLIDRDSASPVSAKSIVWDILKGRVEVKAISTVVAPR